ncbi:MAG: hypothetical protein JXQ73_23655 [Phycisphaerae bacterium]|nr:hypothetical protein [Phycisphaerae bacterium]
MKSGCAFVCVFAGIPIVACICGVVLLGPHGAGAVVAATTIYKAAKATAQTAQQDYDWATLVVQMWVIDVGMKQAVVDAKQAAYNTAVAAYEACVAACP